MLIASALAAGATSTPVDIPHPRDLMRSQLRTFYVYGTFGGTTITIEISPDGTNWFNPATASYTAKSVANLEFRAKQVRVVSTGGAGASINVDMQ